MQIEQLLEQLASEDPHIHEPAAQRLIELGASAAVPLSLVCDTASRFSHRAAAALRKIGRNAVEPLVQVLQTEDRSAGGESPDPAAMVHAILALLLINDPSSLPPLLEALESPFTEVRQAATRALWMLRDRQAVEPLIRHLQDSDLGVAASAATTLGWIGDRQAVQPLLTLLEHPKWQLRAAAAHALGDLGDERALEAIRRHLFERNRQVCKAVKGALTSFHFRKRETEA